MSFQPALRSIPGLLTFAIAYWVGHPVAHATTCDPAKAETFVMTPVSATIDSAPVDLSTIPIGPLHMTRSLPVHPGPGTVPYCVYLGSESFGVELERVQVIEGTPQTDEAIEAMEERATPSARICGSIPYRAIHPGVYKYTKACSYAGDDASPAWPSGASIRVDASRTGILVEYSVDDHPTAITYQVDSATFPEEEPDGCSFRSRAGAPKLLTLALMGVLLGFRPRRDA